MREFFARIVAVAALAGLLGMTVLFAVRQNPSSGQTTAPQPDDMGPAADSVRGRAVFEELGCMRCHSVAGRGSPRVPLDAASVGRTPAELMAWTLGLPEVAGGLAPSVRAAKAANRGAPAASLDDLVRYLATLRGSG